MRRCSLLTLVAVLLCPILANFVVAPPQVEANDCRFVLGFKDIHDQIPDIVGDCKSNEYYNPLNGDALQETTNGLLVWRKADNLSAFTDGYRSWVDDPYGIQQRLNTERFAWERDERGVYVDKWEDGSFHYVVNGVPEVFIGMGYNPIYRYESDAQRAANYDRDFKILCSAGVNTILGWDEDQGYIQDKFDEATLDRAQQFGLGVVMPFYLPPDGDYTDEAFLQGLKDQASQKVLRFKDHPALRMWGVGNEVLTDMKDQDMHEPFGSFYLELADTLHNLDPKHPILYREAEENYMHAVVDVVRHDDADRDWLLYGMNIYTPRIAQLLEDWPAEGVDHPVLVTEFGAEPSLPGGRTLGYLNMWRAIRENPEYTLGGAPYAWTTAGPEPTDIKWGLMDANSKPVDNTFGQLAGDWAKENSGIPRCQPPAGS